MKMLAAGLLVFVGAQQTLPTELGVSQLEPTRIALASQDPAAQQQLPAPQLEEKPQTQLPGALLEFHLRDSPLVAVLNSIAQQAGLNLIVVPPDLTGAPVTIDLQNVTVQQALDAILLPRGLQYRIEDGMLRVETVQMETRNFKFDYITTSRTLSRSLSASSTTGGGGGGFAGAAGAGAGTAAGGGGGGGGSSASLTGQDTTNLLPDVEAALNKLISGSGAKVMFNKMAGIFTVTDFPRFLDAIGLYLETIQTAVHRQVVIEAKVIEVKLNDNSQFGVNWAALLGNAVRLEQPLAGGGGGFNIGVTVGDFNAVVSALKSQGAVNVRSAPTIATLNSQPAIMRVGTQDVFFTTTTQVDPRTGSIVQTSVIPQTIHAGIVLDVTPQISDDGVIMMNIHPTVTERTGQVTGPQGITVPIVDVRETDTVVRVREGNTVMIGGLISDREIVNKDKVPLLGDIPFVGGIFSRSSKETRKTDLVILLTPRVLNLQTAVDFTRSRVENQERLETEKR